MPSLLRRGSARPERSALSIARAVGLAGLLLFVLPAGAQLPNPVPPPLPPPGEMARCKALIDAGQLEAARARLQPIVEAHPRWARALGLLGLTYFKENRFEAARRLFEQALAADPQEQGVQPPYGWTLYALGELEGAAEVFDSLVAARPDYTPGHYALGVVQLERDLLELARRHLETAIRLAAQQGDNEQEGRAQARLGDLLVRQDDLPGARRALERALELAPKEEAARFKLERVRERLGRPTSNTVAAGPTAPPAQRNVAAVPDDVPPLVSVDGAGGIDLVMTSGAMPSREILEVNGGGIAVFDYDGDGDLDVFLANGATLESPERGPGSRLYANRGDGTFEDVTRPAGLELRRWAMGVAVGDYDGDGWDDLYVTCHGPNALLRNEASPDGGRRFRDVALEAGVADARWSTSAAFADLDADGDLDLFVVNYLDFDPARPPARAGKQFKGVPVMAGPRGLPAQADALYENLGNGRFRDASRDAGIVGGQGELAGSTLDYGLGVRIVDLDDDGRPDIFVGNDSTPDQFFRNRGGLRFEEDGAAAGLAANGAGVTQATMGIGLTDADGNGLPDLFLTVFSDDTNTLHLNLGGVFDDRSAQYGLAAPSRPYLGWGCGFYDFDLDGDEDLFLANGHVYPEMEDARIGETWAQRPHFFEHTGARFEPARSGAAWYQTRYHGRATAFGDLDGDLDPEVLMTSLNGPVRMLRSDATGHALAVRLESEGVNRHAYGSRIELESAGLRQTRWITGGGSFQSVDTPEATFGLGDLSPTTKLRLRVRWPDGRRLAIENPPPDRRLVIRF